LEQTVAALRAAEVRLAAAAQRRSTLETEIVPLVDAQYVDARQVARLGEVNTLVLLESLTRLQAAKVGLVEAARDEAIAAIDLDEILAFHSGSPAQTRWWLRRARRLLFDHCPNSNTPSGGSGR
jgi:hypothetical protein